MDSCAFSPPVWDCSSSQGDLILGIGYLFILKNQYLALQTWIKQRRKCLAGGRLKKTTQILMVMRLVIVSTPIFSLFTTFISRASRQSPFTLLVD